MNGWLFPVLVILALAIGIAILVLTIKKAGKGILKIFLLMLGSSLTGFPVFIFLHNTLYGAFIHFFGSDFWKGGDEPFFFILALIICPLGFIVGLVGTLVMIMRRSR
jgi:hypothetical protein